MQASVRLSLTCQLCCHVRLDQFLFSFFRVYFSIVSGLNEKYFYLNNSSFLFNEIHCSLKKVDYLKAAGKS